VPEFDLSRPTGGWEKTDQPENAQANLSHPRGKPKRGDRLALTRVAHIARSIAAFE